MIAGPRFWCMPIRRYDRHRQQNVERLSPFALAGRE
jgi:hypothetical protein